MFASGGFDVAIGNPPYVRQELLSPIKPYLQHHYASYDGVADLYTYFYERGLTLLKPGGVLSYIVTNKWLRAGYGEALRRFFSENSVFEQIIDFGHAPIFQDADTFPCIVVARRVEASPHPPAPSPQGEGMEESSSPHRGGVGEGSTAPMEPIPLAPFPGREGGAELSSPVIICPVPREKLTGINLSQFVSQEGYDVPWSRFTATAWSLEPPAVDELMAKIKRVGVPLKKLLEIKPLLGIKTGLNEAFLIDNNTRSDLIKADPRVSEIIKPYLRGSDIKRWHSEWSSLWMIVLKSSSDHAWIWSKSKDTAEKIFSETFPSLYAYLKPLEDKLKKRQDKGRYWWELRPCAYYEAFQNPKYLIQGIAFHPRISFDADGMYINNAGFILPTSDLWAISVINSPLMWCYIFRHLPHKKDEAIAMDAVYVETLPIAPPTDEIRSEVEPKVSRLIELTKANQESYRDVLDWIKSRFRIEKPGQKLEGFASLDRTQFIDEVRDRIPKAGRKGSDPLGVAGQKEVSTVYNDYALPIQQRDREILTLEHELSDLVNQAYGLTPEEIDLMWKTAPPRMPIKPVKG